jgi:hypothetical protein
LDFRKLSHNRGDYLVLTEIWWGKPIVDDESIVFFVEPIEQQSQTPSGARDGRDVGPQFGDAKRELVGRLQGRVAVPVERLKQQVNQLVGMVGLVFDQAEREVEQKQPERRLQLEEIELTVEVNAEGQLGILGSGGKAGGKGGIKLKFTRK